MKIIESIPMWDNGKAVDGKVLNAHAFNVVLNTSCSFYYSLHSLNENGGVGVKLKEGNLYMDDSVYSQWNENDEYAWEWVANQLSLVITGDYVTPESTTTTTRTTSTTENPTESTTTTSTTTVKS